MKTSCPDCNNDYDLEFQFIDYEDGGQTWAMCTCGRDFLVGLGDLLDEAIAKQSHSNEKTAPKRDKG